jgi:putative oxidoreductase
MGRTLGKYALVALRTWFGGFNLISGLNWYLHIFPQPVPADPVGRAFFDVTVEMGLFQAIKLVEAVCGFLIIFNIATPTALLALLPVTIVVCWLNQFAALSFVRFNGARGLVFHLILMASVWRAYIPLLRLRAP